MLHSLSFSDAFLQMHVRAGCHQREEEVEVLGHHAQEELAHLQL